MKIVRSGITRVVVLVGGYAIKLPRVNYGWMKFVEGVYCNMSERDCWGITKGEWLCPVVWGFGGFVLVMRRVEICKNEGEIECVPNEEGEDRKPDNYGWYEGRVVCVDYPYHRIKKHNRLKE